MDTWIFHDFDFIVGGILLGRHKKSTKIASLLLFCTQNIENKTPSTTSKNTNEETCTPNLTIYKALPIM